MLRYVVLKCCVRLAGVSHTLRTTDEIKASNKMPEWQLDLLWLQRYPLFYFLIKKMKYGWDREAAKRKKKPFGSWVHRHKHARKRAGNCSFVPGSYSHGTGEGPRDDNSSSATNERKCGQKNINNPQQNYNEHRDYEKDLSGFNKTSLDIGFLPKLHFSL